MESVATAFGIIGALVEVMILVVVGRGGDHGGSCPTATSDFRAELIARGLAFAPSHGRLALTVPGFDRRVVDHI